MCFKYLIILILVNICYQHQYKDFVPSAFKINPAEGIYEIDIGFQESNNQNLLGYGDFDGDKNQDILVLTTNQQLNQQQLDIYFWDETKKIFQQTKIQDLNQTQQNFVSQQIGDFDYNGLLDIMLIHEVGVNKFRISFIFQTKRKIFQYSNQVIDSTSIPIQADIYGLKSVQLIYNDLTNNRIISRFDPDSNLIRSQELSDNIETNSKDKRCIDYDKSRLIGKPHWSHYADINGDCMMDLIITSEKDKTFFIETYLRLNSNKFCLVDVQSEMNSNIISVKYVDINADGGIDLVLIKQSSGLSPLFLTFLNQFPVKPYSMCESRELIYPFKSISQPDLNYSPLSKYPQLQLYQSSYQPIILNFGDLNLDGYMDIVLVTININTQLTQSIFLQNDQQGLLKYDEDNQFNKQLKANSQDSVKISFLDIGEDGQLDVIINNKNNKIIGLLYYVTSDTYFIKANILNGVKDETLMGNNIVGATIQCVVTDLNNDQKVVVINQLPMTAYNSLQLPYAHFGLGRTNNYVENLNVAIINKNNNQIKKWSPIIPNTQFIVFPFNPDVSKWKIVIYLQPTKAVQMIIITITIILVILAGAMTYLHVLEKKEDTKNSLNVRNLLVG